MNRLLYNRAIVNKLSELIERYPHLRFGQLLINTEIIELNDKSDSNANITIKDCYNEEPEVTWKRMCRNNFVFE